MWNQFFVVASIVFYLICLVIYCSLISWAPFIYGAPAAIFSDPVFWLALLVCLVVGLMPEYARMYWVRVHHTSLKHVVQERRLLFGERPETYAEYASAEWGQTPANEANTGAKEPASPKFSG